MDNNKWDERATGAEGESVKRQKDLWLSPIYAPARRALANAGIATLEQLSKYREKDILILHGMGKTAIPILKRELEKAGLSFRE